MIKLFITGNVGKEPTIHEFDWGIAANFHVASNEIKKNLNGEKARETTWIQCETKGKLAEMVRDHITKGMKLAVIGEYRQRETENGQHFSYCKVEKIEFLDSKKKEQTNELDFL